MLECPAEIAAVLQGFLPIGRGGAKRLHIAEPLVLRDGFAVAPDRPGHGVAFDWAGLDKRRA